MKNFEIIRNALMSSSLEGSEKMAMIDIFADIPDDSLEEVALLLQKDPSWIEKLNDNRKKKMEAFKNRDTTAWQKIVEEEQAYLSQMTYDLD